MLLWATFALGDIDWHFNSTQTMVVFVATPAHAPHTTHHLRFFFPGRIGHLPLPLGSFRKLAISLGKVWPTGHPRHPSSFEASNQRWLPGAAPVDGASSVPSAVCCVPSASYHWRRVTVNPAVSRIGTRVSLFHIDLIVGLAPAR